MSTHTRIEKINIVPAWETILPTLFAVYEHHVVAISKARNRLKIQKSSDAMKDIKKEFQNMAKAADLYNESICKKGNKG